MGCASVDRISWRRLLTVVGLVLAIFTGGIGVVCATEPADDAADVMLVIDNSGSMRKNDPQFLTPRTVSGFVEQLPDSTHVGMVLFDQRARLLQPLTGLADADARQRLKMSLDKVDYRGKFTDSAAGIERAVYELKTTGRANARQSIIFLTDGIVDTGNRQKDAELTQWLKTDLAAECSAANIRILGVAFTENADFPLIQALASRTGGTYFRATRAEDIAQVLDRIQTLLPPQRMPTEPVDEPPAAPPVPSPVPAADQEKVPPPASDPIDSIPEKESSRSFWKFYVPLIVVIFALTGLVAVLVFKLFSLPTWLRGRKNLPVSAADVVAAAPPEWELQDLTRDDGGVHHFNQMRVTVGRDDKNDLVVATPTVSNLHAIIEYREGAFFLEDQRSTNGTRLNGHQLTANQAVRLKSGDRISFANLEFNFVRLDQIISGDTVMLEITALETSFNQVDAVGSHAGGMQTVLQQCLQTHMDQVCLLGEKYKLFADTYFNADSVSGMAIQASENMERTLADHQQHYSPLLRHNGFFVICTLPVAAADAADWFVEHHGGFTAFISKWIKSEAYDVTACDLFCIVTFGMDQRPWVSLTVVPTHDDPDPVEIMSVNFLTDAEKNELGLEFDDQGRII